MFLIPAGTWSTWASLFFFLAALMGGDLLALRGCLTMAYVFLLINGLTGLPSWSLAAVPGRISVDMICWSLAAGVLHALAVVRMIRDELPVRFASEDERQMARFFNRRSGMEPLEVQEVLSRGSWVRVPAGQRVVSSAQLYEGVYLLVEGVCGFNNACCSSASGSQHPVDLTAPPQSPASTISAAPQGLAALLAADPGQHFTLTRTICLPELPEQPPYTRPTRLIAATRRTTGVNPLKAVAVAAAHRLAAAAAALSAAATPKASPRPHKAGRKGGLGGAAGPDLEASIHTMASSPRHKLSPTSPQVAAAAQPHQRVLHSGHVFSLSCLNVFGVYIGFDQLHGSMFEVWADTDCLLYSWPMSALEEMATACSPSLAAYWRNFITYSVASEFEHRQHKQACRCSTGACEADSWLTGARSRDFTDPLRPYEREQRGLSWGWFKKALSPFPPPGLRHTALPLTGVAARTRAMAMAEARTHAARSRDISLKMGLPPHLQQQQQQQPQPGGHEQQQQLVQAMEALQVQQSMQGMKGMM